MIRVQHQPKFHCPKWNLYQVGQDLEWTTQVFKNQNSYGRWIVGNRRTCNTSAFCYDIRFEPNSSNINNIAGRIVKLDLEIAITASGQSTPEEIDRLSYIIGKNNLTLSLATNNSNIIKAPNSATTFADIDGNAVAFKNTTDEFRVEVMESTTDQAQPTTIGLR